MDGLVQMIFVFKKGVFSGSTLILRAVQVNKNKAVNR